MLKKVISVCLSAILFAPTILANASIKENYEKPTSFKVNLTEKEEVEYSKIEAALEKEFGYRLDELYKENKMLKTDLDNGAKLVGFTDEYIKFTKTKNTKTNEDEISVETFDYNGYLDEIQKNKNCPGNLCHCGCWHPTDPICTCDYVIDRPQGGNVSWLNITMGATYYGDDVFMVDSSFKWRTAPLFTFTDGFGINFTDGMISPSWQTQAGWRRYFNPVTGSEKNETFDYTEVMIEGAGVVATMDLKHGMMHSMGVRTPALWNDKSKTAVNVQANYLHKEISIGSIGISADGMPNLSLGGTSSRASATMTIRRVR